MNGRRGVTSKVLMLFPARRITRGAMGSPAEDANWTVPSMVPVGDVSAELVRPKKVPKSVP